MRVWTSEPSLWVILFLVYAGVSGQNFSVSIVVNPNVAPYTVGDNLMLTCMVDPMPNSNVTTYAWNCIDCFADGSTSSMINRSLTDMDTSNISCLASINGTMYRSDVFDLQVTVPRPNVSVTALNDTQTVGESLTLQCEVTAVRGITSGVDIVWSSGGTELQRMNNVSSAMMNDSLVYTNSYTISQLNTTDEGRVIQCEVVINANPEIRANDSYTLDINVPRPVLTISPSDPIQGAMVGSPQVINCTVSTVSGVESRSVMISWMGPRGNITTTNGRVSIGSITDDGNNMYTRSLQFTYLMEGDNGTYTCNVMILNTNESQSVEIQSLTAPLPNVTVNLNPVQGAMVGSPQTIECRVDTVLGVNNVLINWTGPDGVTIMNSDRISISSPTRNGNVFTSDLQFEYLMEGDEGNYACNVMILGNNVSGSFVIQPIIPTPNVSVTAPSNQTVGQSLTLQCEVTTVRGITSGVDIVWRSGGTERQRMNIMPSAMMNNSLVLVYTNSYNISQLSTNDSGTVIQCEVAVINASPPVMASDSITLNVTVAVDKPEVHQSELYPDEGSSHNLTCMFTLPAGVSRNHLKIDWIRNGSVMTNSSRVMISDIMKTGAQESQKYAKTVTFQNVQSSTDNGTYNCTVNIIGFENFSTITVNVTVIVINDDDDSSSVAGAVVGGVLGALFILVIIIMIMLFYVFWYRRKEPKSYDVETPTRTRKRTTSNHSLSSKNSLIGGKNGNVVPSSPSDIPMAPLEDGVKKRMTPIPLENFSNYVQEMHKDRDLGFEAEYSTISDEAVFTFNAAKTAANNPKNRYVNINPYDYSRVKLLGVTGKGKDTDYINASYIDGFQKPDAYIAAQGPLPDTVKDFWQMIWDHKLQTIVMLTKPVEAGTVKCEVYWPEKVNETLNLKPTLQVRTTYMQYFADFDMRSFEVSNPSEPSDIALQVTHFYFTSWPDHGVPQFATALISFIKKVRKHYSSDGPPMVVHCSAGVGRSGTFITLDTMLQRMPHTNNVNVYEFVHNMRKKRVFMVQTLAQYIFVHDALEELITCGDTSFNAQDMISRVARLSDVIPGKEVTGFEEQFNLLQKVSRQFNEGDCSDALSQHNISKNRSDKAVPYNVSRVQMKATPLPGSDYINASFVDGYKHRNAFIVTQCPMENTVNDFWRMMWESQSAVIVMLCSEQHDPEDFYKYWPDEEAEYGKIKVTTKSKVDRSSYTGYKFAVLGESVKMTPLQVTLLHYTQWAPLQAPVNTKALLGVTKELLEIQRHTGNKAITVMCSDGCGRSGSFITIYYTLERVKAEQTVDIFQAIKNSRIRRTGLVSNAEQYKQCHQAITEFLDEFSAYANFI